MNVTEKDSVKPLHRPNIYHLERSRLRSRIGRNGQGRHQVVEEGRNVRRGSSWAGLMEGKDFDDEDCKRQVAASNLEDGQVTNVDSGV